MAKRKTPTPKDGMVRVLPDLPFEIGADDAEIKKADGDQSGMSTTVAQLQEQLAQMQANLKLQQETNLALMQQTPTVIPTLRPTEVNMDDLPDPVTDAKGYAAEVAKRTREAMANEKYNEGVQAKLANDQTTKINALWEDFAEKYSDYAKDPSRVEYIANKLAQRAQARGRDVGKYMFGASSQFFADAVALYDKEFGKPGAGDDDAEDGDDGASLLDADEIRTAGIPGGGPKGQRLKSDEDAEVQGKSMFDGLRQWQQKAGFSI